jgi:hypothetical protein
MIERAICDMIGYFGGDARRINHALKVYGFACAIAGGEGLTGKERTALLLAAVLHDIGIPEAERKYGSSSGAHQEAEGPPVARQLLERAGVDKETVDRVCHIVGNHHSYHTIDGIDFQILVEADFLVNIFEDDMGRGAVESVRDKYFRTRTGRALLESIYLREQKTS